MKKRYTLYVTLIITQLVFPSNNNIEYKYKYNTELLHEYTYVSFHTREIIYFV